MTKHLKHETEYQQLIKNIIKRFTELSNMIKNLCCVKIPLNVNALVFLYLNKQCHRQPSRQNGEGHHRQHRQNIQIHSYLSNHTKNCHT